MRLLCQNAPAPCGTCRNCARISRGAHPSVRSIQAPGAKGEPVGLPIELPDRATRAAERVISIELVRAMQHDAALAGSDSDRKVYVVTGADSLSLPAANALLKTVEEPPAGVVIILTANDQAELLPTIVSRCQPVRFGLVSPHEIADGLVRLQRCPPERADLLAKLAGGRPGWAIDAATNPDLLSEREQALDELDSTTSRSFRERLNLAEKLAASFSRDQAAVYQTLSLWQVWWWDVYLIQIGCAEMITNVDRFERVQALARATASPKILAYLNELTEAATRLAQNVNARLALETLLLGAPTIE